MIERVHFALVKFHALGVTWSFCTDMAGGSFCNVNHGQAACEKLLVFAPLGHPLKLFSLHCRQWDLCPGILSPERSNHKSLPRNGISDGQVRKI